MQDKPLDRAERDLLAVLLRLEAERGPVSREVLSVEARGRGLEFGRSFARLKGLGLLIEVERRPFFLLRLFGARTTQVLRLTEAGRLAAAVGQTAEAPAPEAPAPEAPAPEAPAPEAIAPVVPTAPATATASQEPPATIGAVLLAPGLPAPPASIPDQSATLSPSAEPDTTKAVAEPLTVTTAAEPPLAATGTAAEPPLAATGTAAEPPLADLLAEPAVSDDAAARARVRAATARPRRLPLTAFTEVLGGTPLDEAALPQPAQADPAVVQALRETLAGLGIDLTMAGEMLIAERLAKGARPAEALSQVVVYAFAHAVRHALAFGHADLAPGMADYAEEVMRELTRLKDASEIGPAVHEADLAHLRILTGPAEARGTLAEVLLADPFGGAAPPAVLPEELRQGQSDQAPGV